MENLPVTFRHAGKSDHAFIGKRGYDYFNKRYADQVTDHQRLRQPV
jgi:hypothetical protein